MRILFIHNNFPAQFRALASCLSRERGVSVAAIGAGGSQALEGVQLVRYSLDFADVSATHPFARRFDLECRRAEQVLYALSALASRGFVPDVVVAHPGWGETIPVRTVFPSAKTILYCEFFYRANGQDCGFDPEFPSTGLDGHVGLHLKNAATLLALEDCDVGVSPTSWQHSTYPAHFRPKIHTIHEGIDTSIVKPNADAKVILPDGSAVSEKDEVLTYVSRDFEPLRGFHVFMRALPAIMRHRPNLRVMIVGRDGTSYGAHPPTGKTWKSIFLEEVRGKIDLGRVHFLGPLQYDQYLRVLQISSVHVYLTYPFVLSWSCLEAMSAGCVVVGSDTEPVREVINGENGLLVPFFDAGELARRVVDVLADPEQYEAMRKVAREYIVANFDLQTVCLPKMLSLVRSVCASRSSFLGRRVWPGRQVRRSEHGGKLG
ncbi:glycosyltransferase [Rhodopseudomonas palustris]|nr:glycosyltransferase [Rhodopseudomonas palustris]QLH73894.1 glycosyltransferase [Rhodopseudomonas palustris]RHZ94878.1 glycosyltransferase [Rhodopseudomonas palustris]